MSDEKPDPKPSDAFRLMADRIDMNDPTAFGGAFVVVPPGGYEAVETLIIDSGKDPAQFWGILQARAQIALAKIDDEQRQGQGVGFRGR